MKKTKKMQTLKRKILETLIENDQGLTFSELFEKVGGNKEDVLNLLNELLDSVLVEIKGDKYFSVL